MVREQERITDVAFRLYVDENSRRPIENVDQIKEDLWTWWAEADLRPSPIMLFMSDGLLNDKYGNNLVLQTKAAAIIRKDRVELDRVKAELQGVERLETILSSLHSNEGVIYLSPPGSEKEGFGAEGRRRLSFTYIYHVGNSGRIHFLAIPELERPIKEHIANISDLVDRDKTASLVGTSLGNLNDREVVGYPFAAYDSGSLDILARRLGYVDLVDLWKQALDARRSRGKVGELIDHASSEVWDAYCTKDYEKLDVMGDVFRGITALLVANDLRDVVDINEYFDRKVAAIIGAKNVDNLGDLTIASYTRYSGDIYEFQARLLNNQEAMEIVEGGSCPGDRDLQLNSNGWSSQIDPFVSNHVMQDVLGWGRAQPIEVDANPGSTGKYKQYYDYKPGVCAHCHLFKEYVAYPKSKEVQCAGFCSDCEK